MTGRSRELLHRNKLRQFSTWAQSKGYLREETKGAWEALRLRLPNAAGTNQPIIIYERARGDHLTVFGDGLELVRRWLAERKERPA